MSYSCCPVLEGLIVIVSDATHNYVDLKKISLCHLGPWSSLFLQVVLKHPEGMVGWRTASIRREREMPEVLHSYHFSVSFWQKDIHFKACCDHICEG